MLRRGEIYFASAAELNDASECRPHFIFKGSRELWQRLAGFVLEHVCFCSGYFQRGYDDQIPKVLDLSEPVGSQLKKDARNRDLGLKGLSSAFSKALKMIGAEKLQPPLLNAVEHLAVSFIEQGLPRVLQDRKYIASFALNATNPTMWGHYAEAEKGFVRVFQTEDGKLGVHSELAILHGTRPSKIGDGVTEVGIYKDELLDLKHVQYGKRIPKVNAFHRLIPRFSYTEEEDHYDVPLMIGGDAEEKKEHLIGLTKYSDWRYEKEVRAFFPAFESFPSDARALRLSTRNIKGLVFGPKMSEENKVRAVICSHIMHETYQSENNAGHEFVFFQAQQAVESFNFLIHPVGILGGHYFGRSLPLTKLSDLDEATVARLHALADEIKVSGRASSR